MIVFFLVARDENDDLDEIRNEQLKSYKHKEEDEERKGEDYIERMSAKHPAQNSHSDSIDIATHDNGASSVTVKPLPQIMGPLTEKHTTDDAGSGDGGQKSNAHVLAHQEFKVKHEESDYHRDPDARPPSEEFLRNHADASKYSRFCLCCKISHNLPSFIFLRELLYFR